MKMFAKLFASKGTSFKTRQLQRHNKITNTKKRVKINRAFLPLLSN
jgi:hypothetical protein